MAESPKHRLESDMSEPAINRRMQRLGDLHRLAQSLKTAAPVPPVPSAVREPSTPYPAPADRAPKPT